MPSTIQYIRLERWQLGEWFLLENTSYENDSNGQALRADYQVFQNNSYRFFRWLFEFDEFKNITSLERQERDLPNYNWIENDKCDYFRNLSTSLEAVVISPELSCTFPNPYVVGTTISCDDLDEEKTYQVQVYNMSGQLFYQHTVMGNQFSLNKKLPTGIYVMAIYYGEKVMAIQQVIWRNL